MKWNQKKVNLSVFFLIIIMCCIDTKIYGAVTYSLNGGRLGDNLRSFSHAYWLSYKHGIPFLFRPFKWSECMRMHYVYDHYTPECNAHYRYKNVLRKGQSLDVNGLSEQRLHNTLITTTFYCKAGVSWSDKEFVAQMRELIAPHKQWNYMPLPKDMPTVAIHMRRGGGYSVDTNACRRRRPLHFPNMSYYQQALQLMLKRYISNTCYVYIFTDDPNPEGLVKTLLNSLTEQEQERVKIQCRTTGNRHNANVLEDFFDMMRFDYLIRPNSMMSVFAQRLGDHTVVMHPKKGRQGNPWGIVTDVEICAYTDDSKCAKECVAIKAPPAPARKPRSRRTRKSRR